MPTPYTMPKDKRRAVEDVIWTLMGSGSPYEQRYMLRDLRAELARTGITTDATDDELLRLLRRVANQYQNRKRRQMPRNMVVELDCGHRVECVKPLMKRTCRECGDEVVRLPAAIAAPGDDRWIPVDKWREMRDYLNRAPAPPPPSPRAVPERLQHTENAKITGFVNDIRTARSDVAVFIVAQDIHASGLWPQIHQAATETGVDTRIIDWLMTIAETGIVPEKAWYAQYGARAISQAIGGRPTLTPDEIR